MASTDLLMHFESPLIYLTIGRRVAPIFFHYVFYTFGHNQITKLVFQSTQFDSGSQFQLAL